MVKRLKKFFNGLFDYDIIGEYIERDKKGIYDKKYIKRYRLRKF